MNRVNNFDFLRLVFAIFVIVSHSYPLTGSLKCDWLCELSNGQIILSYVGVKGFFVLSGYLIYQSMERSKSVFDYFFKRFLRLFPALFVMLILTLTVLVPIAYQGNANFYSDPSYWSYFWKNLLLYPTQYFIDGVFENNPHPNIVNGSLWTIAYEFTMYVCIALFLGIRQRNVFTKWLVTILVCVLIILQMLVPQLAQKVSFGSYLDSALMIDLGTFFLIGSTLAAHQIERLTYKWIWICIFLLLIAICIYSNVFMVFRYFILPLPILLFGLSATRYLKSIGEYVGDLSYGIYIYGFPIQQLVVYYLNPIQPIVLTFIGLLITGIVSYCSWHWIEAPALKLKRYASTPKSLWF
ncbi:MAG: acyltransferase [Bacteroidia bacterium]|jgi:peptidoglycan/LPS O-acetylase OafA/YrhL|nr:acyltransferase [Bacteroidia bacterium]